MTNILLITIFCVAALDLQTGNEAQMTVSLSNDSRQYVSLQYDIRLPEGIEPVTGSDGKVVITKSGTLGIDAVADCEQQTDGTYRFILYSPSNTPIAEGDIFTFAVKASPTTAAGDYKATVTGITMTTAALQKVNADDIAATITVTPSTAVTDVTASAAAPESFNLHGVKVDRTYRGVVIRDGKKVLVK